MCGKAVHCGGWCFRSNEGELLRGLPHTHSSELDANAVMAKLGVKGRILCTLRGAAFGAVDTSSLEKLNAKDLAWSSSGQTRENCIAPKPPPAGNTHARTSCYLQSPEVGRRPGV